MKSDCDKECEWPIADFKDNFAINLTIFFFNQNFIHNIDPPSLTRRKKNSPKYSVQEFPQTFKNREIVRISLSAVNGITSDFDKKIVKFRLVFNKFYLFHDALSSIFYIKKSSFKLHNWSILFIKLIKMHLIEGWSYDWPNRLDHV